jgi:hypothetical protein
MLAQAHARSESQAAIAVLGSASGSPTRRGCAVVERHGLLFATTTMAKGRRGPSAAGARAPAGRCSENSDAADLIVGWLRHDRGQYEAWIGDAARRDRHRAGRRRAIGQARTRRAAISMSHSRWSRRCPPAPMRGRPMRSPRTGALAAALRPATIPSRRTRRSTRCGARRATACSLDVGAHTQIGIGCGARMRRRAFDHQRLVVDGFRPAGRDRGKFARPDAGYHPDRRRLLPDDAARSRWPSASGAADRRARRQAGSRQSRSADPPPVPLYGTELQPRTIATRRRHWRGGGGSAPALEAAVTQRRARATVIEVVDSEHYVDKAD